MARTVIDNSNGGPQMGNAHPEALSFFIVIYLQINTFKRNRISYQQFLFAMYPWMYRNLSR